MTTIFDGRFTAQTEEPFVVFLFRMRINFFRYVCRQTLLHWRSNFY